jgi:hypothetical protein
MEEAIRQMSEDIGYIKGKVESIEKHAETQNSKVAINTKKVQTHDIILGKFGAFISIVAFVVSITFNAIWTWIKTNIA